MKKYVIIILTQLFFFYCSGQIENTERHLNRCVNKKTNEHILNSYGFDKQIDLYKILKKSEYILLKNNLLEDNTKKGYIKFLKKIKLKEFNIKKPYDSILKLMNSNFYDLDEYYNNSILFRICPATYLTTVDKNSTLYKQVIILSKLEADGFTNIYLLTKLINDTKRKDFKKIEYRAPIILLTILYMKRTH